VTTGFANLSDGAKVLIGTDDRAPTADLAPRKRSRSPDAKGDSKGDAKGGQGKDGQAKEGQAREGQGKDGEHRGKRERGEGDQKGQTGPASAEPSGGAAKSQP
jgi:multidrug efflux system membrane fusion protein